MKNFKYVLTKEYWNNDNEEIVHSRWKLFGLVAIILVCLFGFIVAKEALVYSDDKFNITEKQANERAAKASVEIAELKKEIKIMQEKVDINTNRIEANTEKFELSLEKLNSIPNEKDYITPATAKQRDEFLSKYKYQPYGSSEK